MTTFPDLTQSEKIISTDGTRTVTIPDGTTSVLVEGPDPRFGMQAPRLESRVATAPGGLVLTVTSESSVNLADPNDALRLTTLTDMVSVNSRPFTRTYDSDTKTFTNTTPEGRQGTTSIDTQGRVGKEQVAGIETRIKSFSYNRDGYLIAATSINGGNTVTFG